MPDNDNGSSRSEPGNQTNECPTNKPPVPEKTESTPQEEAKTQDAPSPESEEDPFEAEQIAEFEAWVESLKVDPDSAWRQLRIKFDALMASEMADAVDQDNQGTGNPISSLLNFPLTDHVLCALQMRLPRLQKPPNTSRQNPKRTPPITKITAVTATRPVSQ
ncbi:hypothetical protein CDV31_000954 [Fusarium ambrosium]|uniref:Uncharacterized protein n=1 Tax=Fusarium ambrosium TaxID=131363 RepID=A0A428V0T7_9HYPO|nr:hypothetical protein CDV31_000954 [Fusarium ambrosium]